MRSYPNIDDDNFYTFINKKYNKYKIPEKKKSLKEICFQKKYELQIPQKFLADFINPNTPYTGLLVYHKIGGGKTCVAVNIAEGFRGSKNIMVVLPASLKGNFRAVFSNTRGVGDQPSLGVSVKIYGYYSGSS